MEDARGRKRACAVEVPQAVVTKLGILEPNADGELILTALHPGVTVAEAQANTGWVLQAAAELRITEPPGAEELRILREELDPNKIYLS
jgi:glutaconate CoA-transferase subunit B